MRRPLSMVVEPNVVPMIDVLLVLLVIFMLANVADVRRTFDLQLPQPERGASSTTPIVLRIASGPNYSVNGSSIPAENLEQRLRAIFSGRPDKVLFVDAERSLPYRTVASAFDAARGAGVSVTAVMLKR